ncbi:MAG: CHASE3 domain-containing protein [Chitinophagaceae bacterium]|nr:CHASE3 domain-containing protein [Chitinophagaceae bacterium]
MKIVYYIFFSFLLILLLFATTTFINFRLSGTVNANTEYLSTSTEIIRYSGRFQRNILNMVSGLRGYLLTGERSFIDAYDASNTENDTILAELGSMVADTLQYKLLMEIKELNDKWTEEYTEPLRKAKMLASVSDSNLQVFNRFYRERFLTGDERAILANLQQKFKAFSNLEYNVRQEKKTRLTELVDKTRRLSFWLTGLSLILALAIVVFLVRKISRRIAVMTQMANDIAAGNYDVNIKDPGNDELSSLGYSLNHMADQLFQNISLLKRSNEELDQFAHIVSHDMKSPLRGISNVVSWIEEDHKEELSQKVEQYLHIIKERIARAESLIEGILSYARIDKEEVEKETTDLNRLVYEILENLPVGSNVKVEVSPLPIIYSEKFLIFQVFSNLIGNAIKYNDKEMGLVKISCEEHLTEYEFFVEDNGIGIAPVYHKKIFVIFQTLADKDIFSGTGVGLAIVKKILDSKKQHIRLSSVPGKGSVFSFTWPKY